MSINRTEFYREMMASRAEVHVLREYVELLEKRIEMLEAKRKPGRPRTVVHKAETAESPVTI